MSQKTTTEASAPVTGSRALIAGRLSADSGRPTVPRTVSGARQVDRPVVPVLPRRESKPDVTELRLTPYAWAKYQFLCHCVTTEIGAMGIGLSREDPMTIVDLVVPKQEVSEVHTKFDDLEFNRLLDRLCDPEGEHRLHPVQCSRVWFHTHPGFSPTPSLTDEGTFSSRWASKCSWAVMAILATDGSMYARLSRNDGKLRTAHRIRPVLAWDQPFAASDHEKWLKEVADNLHEVSFLEFSPLGAPCKLRDYNTDCSQTIHRVVSDYDPIFEDWHDEWVLPPLDQDDAVDRALATLKRGSSREQASTPPWGAQRLTPTSRPKIQMRPQDLLYPLSVDERAELWNEPFDTSKRHSPLLEKLEVLGIRPCGYTSNAGVKLFGSKPWMLLRVSPEILPKKRLRANWSEGLTARELFEVSEPLELDDENLAQVAKLELRLSAAQRSEVDWRSPSLSMMRDTYGRTITELMPWVRLDNTLIWLTPEEMEWMESVVAGEPASSIPVGPYGARHRDPPPPPLPPPLGPATGASDADTPDEWVSDDLEDTIEQMFDILVQLSYCVEGAIVDNSLTGAEELDDLELDRGIQAQRRGADEGGYRPLFDAVLGILESVGYDAEEATTELDRLVEQIRSGQTPVPGSKPAVEASSRVLESAQATLEEVNEGLGKVRIDGDA